VDVLLVVVFVGEVDDVPDAALDDELGTLVAREQRHINLRTYGTSGDRIATTAIGILVAP